MCVAGNFKIRTIFFQFQNVGRQGETKDRTCDICVAGIRCVKRLTLCYLHQKQLVKHFQAAGMRCFDQHALESFIKNDFISTR